MQYPARLRLSFSHIIGLGVILALLLVIACGAAATATPAPAATRAPVATAAPAATAVPAATATPAPTAPPARKRVDKLVIMQGSMGNEQWNPKWDTVNNIAPLSELHARLITANDKLELDPANSIVNKWELTDGGLGWEFTVRDGVKFHNGEELNVDDAIFSQRMIIAEDSASTIKVRWARAIQEHATKTGPNSFKILFIEPAPAYPVNGMGEIEPSSNGIVLSKDYYESVGEEGFQANPSPGSAGPFNMIEYRAKQGALLEKFDDYYLKEIRDYAFTQLSIELVPELSTRVAALVAGSADIISADLNVIDQIESAGGSIKFSPMGNYIWVFPHNCQNPSDKDGNPLMCNDLRVRQALDYAIDKEEIQELYGADAFKIAGMPTASPASLGYKPDLDPYPFDPNKAKQLLAEAGYPDGRGFNGGRVFNIWTFAGPSVPLMPEVATLVCSHWTKVLNIKCEVKVGDEVAIKDQFYDGLIDGQYLVRPNDYLYDGASRIRGGFAVPDAYGSYLGDVAGTRVRELLSTIGTQEERHEAYYQANKILQDLHYSFSPGYLDTPFGVSKRIKSWKPLPLQVGASAIWTIEFN